MIFVEISFRLNLECCVIEDISLDVHIGKKILCDDLLLDLCPFYWKTSIYVFNAYFAFHYS